MTPNDERVLQAMHAYVSSISKGSNDARYSIIMVQLTYGCDVRSCRAFEKLQMLNTTQSKLSERFNDIFKYSRACLFLFLFSFFLSTSCLTIILMVRLHTPSRPKPSSLVFFNKWGLKFVWKIKEYQIKFGKGKNYIHFHFQNTKRVFIDILVCASR